MGLLGSLLLGAAALGFDHLTADVSNPYVVVWRSGTIPMLLKINQAPPAPLADGSPSYNASVQTAMQAWNAQLGVTQINGTVDTTPTPPGYNGNQRSEILMDSTVDGDAFPSGGTLAITASLFDGDTTRVESDIVFNTNSITWDSYRGPRRPGTGAAVDIQRVALHELGHVLGMDHPDAAGQQVSAIMNSRVSDADVLLADDIEGAQVLYGSPGFVPANNNFASATTLTLPASNTASFNGSTVAATKEIGEPNHVPNEPGARSVWWKWTANGSGSTTVTTLGSNFDSMLGVYTGSLLAALTSVGSNDDEETPQQNPSQARKRTSKVIFNAVNGTTYYFAVDGWDGAFGAVTLNVSGTLTGGSTAPVITTHPASLTVTAGNNVTFSVVATGVGPLTYQWSFAGNPISGATGDTHIVNNVQSGNAGFYAVVVTNAAGSTTSNTATLTVTAAPPPPPPPPSSGGGGGGGGAPSLWFYCALALLGLGRYLRRRE